MYNMIEEIEPANLNDTENYLYFNEDSIMENELPGIDEFVNNVDLLESMSSQDFTKLLNSYSLSNSTKQAYETKFQKAKRIYKRDKAKTRNFVPCLKLLQPLIETSESAGVKIQHDTTNNKDTKQEEQKRRKRMSAQLSRDKKKIYVQHIQRQNQELKQRCKQLEAENQRLKQYPKSSSFQRKNSLKGWFILSLILFSLQKQKQMITPQSLPTNLLIDQHLFQNPQRLIEQYQKQPLPNRVLHLQKFKHLVDLPFSLQESVTTYQTPPFRITQPFKPQLKQQPKQVPNIRKRIKNPYYDQY